MAYLFGRKILLDIAQEPTADAATIARIRARVFRGGQLYGTKEGAEQEMALIQRSFGNSVLWKFADDAWGVVTNAEAAALYGPPSSQGKRFEASRISFKVKRTSDGKPNKCSIQLYNPNPDTVTLVQDRRAIVRLFGGYDFAWQLFQGNPIKDGVSIERSGPDRILSIEAQDGKHGLSKRINLNFSTNTKLSDVLQAVSEQSGLGLGFVADLEDVDLPYGIHMDGSPKEVLERLATMSDAEFSVQDGAIQVVKTANDTGEPAVLLSVKNGNLLKVARKDKGRITATALLNGTIRPGRRFVVQSEYINGIFKAIDVEHTGDLFEDAFTTSITARPWAPPSPSSTSGAVNSKLIDSILRKVAAAGQLYDSFASAQNRANRLDFASAQDNVRIARFLYASELGPTQRFGIVTKAEAAQLERNGVAIFLVGAKQ